MSVGAYEPVIGLEVHVQLKTRTKLFCGCPTEYGAPPNTQVCPVCLGLPGALPTVNRQAVELAVLAARALNCTVNPRSVFARKNYFYPDLPKGYQISQFEAPLATGGWLEIPADGDRPVRVRLRRLHLEEDAGKSLHDRFPGRTAVDLNRCGIPLIEIVTEPDLLSPAHARAFLGRLKQVMEYTGVSECDMEKGSLRVDANLSVRPRGSAAFGTKAELKNLNSFSQLEKALAYEVERQAAVLASGGRVEQETLLWDPVRGETRPMRGKEESHDYRYFPDPDLPVLEVAPERVEELERALPEMPWDRSRRFVTEYGLPQYDADVLTSSRDLADYFEAVAQVAGDAKAASNWVMRDVLELVRARGVDVGACPVRPAALAELLGFVRGGTLSLNLARQVFQKMADSGKSAAEIVRAEALVKVADAGQIEAWVAEVVAASPDEVARYRSGEGRLFGHFMGEVMKRSHGKADPKKVRALLAERLRP
ncbi:MAG: Asp-tRNA(Asn)/Glu-tRNA(Gln) amidotransferase subunit GatB [Gemmatimonadetes bacterium]|nr:Asp-tRNA(Asn)/Glu-tRNA(Gln) amidotransferase subunit GatB [Gemmatimonadota bacterium]